MTKGTARHGTFILASHQVGHTKYELRSVGCGKPNCNKCPHGPYWWALIKLRHGKQVPRYIGKTAPEDLQAHIDREEALLEHERRACTTCGKTAGTSPTCPECTQALNEANQPIKRSNCPRKGSEMCLHCGSCGEE